MAYRTYGDGKRRTSRVSEEDWFWEQVDRGTEQDCWGWTRGCDDHGYGNYYFRGSVTKTNRVAWILTYGEIPEGMFVCHHCDNPPCCNPAHLFLGTHADNMQDKSAKGRHKNGFTGATHCKRGHEFTPENTRFVAKGRRCRICQRAEPGRQRI